MFRHVLNTTTLNAPILTSMKLKLPECLIDGRSINPDCLITFGKVIGFLGQLHLAHESFFFVLARESQHDLQIVGSSGPCVCCTGNAC